MSNPEAEAFNAEESPPRQHKTHWHRLLATLLELVLTPLGISVQSEVQVMKEPGRIDLLLIRREGNDWNEAQFRLLPDGVRQSKAREILIECKIVESIDEDALQQGQGYDFFYRQSQRLRPQEVQSFLLSAITPRRQFFEASGYCKSEISGVYRHAGLGLRRLPLIVINQLSDEPHNAFVQCFASRRRVRERAFAHLRAMDWQQLSDGLWEFTVGLQNQMSKSGDNMLKTTDKEALTSDYVKQIGKQMRQALLATLSPEERLAGLAPEERLAGLAPEERLAGLAPEERLAGLAPEERLAGLTPEEIATLLARVEEWLQQQPNAK